MRQVVSISVPDREAELWEFLSQLDSGEKSKFGLEAMKLALARSDLSYIYAEIEVLNSKLNHLNKIKEWKDAWDKVEMENLVRLQHSEVLKKYSKWYQSRMNMSKANADAWLTDVLPDIQDELEYKITEKQFLEFTNKRGEIIGKQR